MAEGEQVSGRRPDLTRNCTPCSGKGLEQGAEKYCFRCETFFCRECTQRHNELFKEHRLTEIESEDLDIAMTLHSEACLEHGKVVRLYCMEHDTVGCEICIASQHEPCRKVVYLPTFAQEFLKDIDINGIFTVLGKKIQQLESIELRQQATLTSFTQDKERCMQEINDHHRELHALLDKTLILSKDSVERTFQHLCTDLQNLSHEIQTCLADLGDVKTQLENTQNNDVRLFMEIKRYQKQFKTSEVLVEEALENLAVRGFCVDVDERVHSLLEELESLVTVLQRSPVQVTDKFRVTISEEGDNVSCVYGSCVLNDGSVILADSSNKMLKKVDPNSRALIEKCSLQDSCTDVCCLDNDEVAVTQVNQTVVIVSVKPHLSPTRVIKMDHSCACVAYSQGDLFISDRETNVYVYKTDGSLSRKICKDTSGHEMFSRSGFVAVSDRGDKLFVLDDVEGLLTLNRQGRLLNSLVSDKILRAQGVCLDEWGGQFVCGLRSCNVVYVSPVDLAVDELLTRSGGLVKPLSVCYDRIRKRLFVSQYNSDELHVCQVTSTHPLTQQKRTTEIEQHV